MSLPYPNISAAAADRTAVAVGAAANDGTGDPLRTAFIRSNARDAGLEVAIDQAKANFDDLDTRTTAVEGAALLMNPRGEWVTGTNYVFTPGVRRDWFTYLGDAYVVAQTHTAGVFATDEAAGRFFPSDAAQIYTDLHADITAAIQKLESVSKANPVLNGAMRIAQTGTSFNVTAGALTRTIDGWNYGGAGAAALTVSQAAGTTPENANAKWLLATVTTADGAIAASDYATIFNRLEGYDVEDLVGRTFSLSFYVRAPVAGNYCVYLRNSGLDRYYIAQFTVSTANTAQKVTVTVTGGLPAAGTWNFTTGVGLELGFVLAAGTDLHGTAGAWTAGSKQATASQANALATIGNVFGITEVQISLGSVVPPFPRTSFEKELARCQRYYEEVDVYLGISDTTALNHGYWKVPKRVPPTVSLIHGVGSGSSVTATFGALNAGLSVTSFIQAGSSSSGSVAANKKVVGDARL